LFSADPVAGSKFLAESRAVKINTVWGRRGGGRETGGYGGKSRSYSSWCFLCWFFSEDLGRLEM